MAFVNKVTPPFDAQYAARSFIATSPSTDPIFTIAPPPHFRNSFSAARDIRNGPFTFTIITRSHSSSVMLSTVETCSAPALFTSTFSRPNCLTVSRTARSTSLSRVTSHSTAEALPPSFFTSPVTARSFSGRRPAKATLAPSRANARAIARPIPVPPPLISATFPESRVTLFGAPASNRDAAAPRSCAGRVGATLASGSLARKPLRWTPAASRSGLKVLYFNDPSLTCRRIEDRSYAHRDHMLPNLRRLGGRRHRAWHGARRARARRAFHQLCPADSHEPQRRAHPLPRSRSRLLSSLRPSSVHPGARHENARSFRIRSARPSPRPLRDSPFRQRLARAFHGRAAPPSLHHHASRHGHHPRRQQPQLSPHHQVLHRAERWRHLHLPLPAESNPQRVRYQAPHRSHSQFRELRSLQPLRRQRICGPVGPQRRTHPHASLEFPSREAPDRHRRNLRHCPRQDARQAGPHRRRPGPRRRRIPRAQEKTSKRCLFPRQAGQYLRKACRRRSFFASLAA